jgi:hypothetical protein
MAVFAHPGDTIQSLATLYHAPMWSLTALNHVTDGTALTPGQRIVVPRHLVPAVEAADGAPAGQTQPKH